MEDQRRHKQLLATTKSNHANVASAMGSHGTTNKQQGQVRQQQQLPSTAYSSNLELFLGRFLGVLVLLGIEQQRPEGPVREALLDAEHHGEPAQTKSVYADRVYDDYDPLPFATCCVHFRYDCGQALHGRTTTATLCATISGEGGRRTCGRARTTEVQVVHAAENASAAPILFHNVQHDAIYLAKTDGLLHPETMTDPATCRERALCSYVVSLVNGHKLKATSAASS